MKQIDALKKLAEKVEENKHLIDGGAVARLDEWPPRQTVNHIAPAYNGHLDAAHSLHKAVLGDRWIFTIKQQSTVGNRMCVEVTTPRTGGNRDYHYGYHIDNPARAWLLAIIKAKISELGGCVMSDELKVRPTLSTLESLREIVDGSDSVIGWHLNGDAATWGDLNISVDEIDEAITAITRTDIIPTWQPIETCKDLEAGSSEIIHPTHWKPLSPPP